MKSTITGSDVYGGISILVWVLVFVGTWIGCIVNYGFLLGVGLGWLPAAIVATISALLWPLALIAIAVVVFLVYRH